MAIEAIRPATDLVGLSPRWVTSQRRTRHGVGRFVMALVLLVLGGYLIAPLIVLVIMSFNVAPDVLVPPFEFGLASWIHAWDQPLLLTSLWNSFLVWFLTVAISLPAAIAIAWVLARTNVRWSSGLEYMFWVAFMFPTLSSTLGWMMVLDPEVGYANQLLQWLGVVDQGPFNVFSLPGIVWARLMADGIAYKVMLLTPAFRNMDSALEEASRVAGASSFTTIWRVTLPMMAAPIALVFALQLIRVFEGFETELLLGAPWGFYVYSTLIYRLVSVASTPMYSEAIVLAMVTFAIIAVIIPIQRKVVNRRPYTTLGGSFRPGLTDLGRARGLVFGLIVGLLVLLTLLPLVTLVVGSFMARSGFFETSPLWTLEHWQFVFGDPLFLNALGTTLLLAVVAGIASPILFSLLAYLIVRTRLRGRALLDSIIWISAGVPGILSGLGLLLIFLTIPGLSFLYGSIWALMLVLVISGNTTGTNVLKGVFVQLGTDVEEAARVSGASWIRTYATIVLPLLMPTMVLIGVLNFAGAAGATSSIVLLASRNTTTLSLLTLEYAAPEIGQREAAGIVSLVIMGLALGMAMVARSMAQRMGVQHGMRLLGDPTKEVLRERIE